MTDALVRRLGRLLALILVGTALGAHAEDLRFTAGEYSGFTRPFFERVARDYEAQHPGTRIHVEVVPWDSYLQKLTTDISSGNQPDLSIVPTMWIPDLAAEKLLAPLDEIASPDFKSMFIPAFLTPSTVDGRLLGVPAAASARAMVVNLDLLERAGAPLPKSWDEFMQAARLVAKQPNAYGFGLPGKEVEVDTYFYYALWSMGGDIIKDGRSGLSSPEAIRAASLYRTLIDEKLTEPSPTAHSREDVFKLFKEGRIGMVFTYPMLVPQLKAEAPGMHFAVMPIPAATEPFTLGVADVMVLSSSSKASRTAWDFATFTFKPAYRAEFDRAEGLLPVTRDATAQDVYKDNPDISAFASGLPHARFLPTIKGWADISDITTRTLQVLYLGEQSPAQAMTEAARQIDGVLARQ